MENRKIYADILRLIAIIAVITIHVSSGPLFDMSIFGQKSWWYANVFDSVSRWSVTVFIMISGMLLLNTNKKEKYSAFFKKRLSKVLLPFLFWSLFYYIYNMRHALNKITVKSIVIAILQGGIYYHLWFMYVIIGIYLVVPILRKFISACSTKDLGYFIALYLLSCPILQLITKFYKINIGFSIPIVSDSIGIFILGYVIDSISIKKVYKIIIYVLGVVGTFITILGTYLLSKNHGIDEFFYVYSQLNNIVIAVAIFVFIKELLIKHDITNSSIRQLIINISNLSFGIYLIHPFILHILTSGKIGFKISYEFVKLPYGIPITATLIFLASYFSIFIMGKVKFIKSIIS